MKSKNYKYKSKRRISKRRISKRRISKRRISKRKSQSKKQIKNNYKRLTRIGKKWVKQMEIYMKLIEDQG